MPDSLTRFRTPVIGLLLIWGMMCLSSFVRVPIPGINEPHYLGKAKHYWDTSYCPGDLFLDSAEAHLFFYQTFGLLTTFLALEATAIVGRLLGLLLLAIGVQRLLRSLTGSDFAPVIATAIWLAITHVGNFSGEWVVRGIEGKVPAYAFGFWALGRWLDRTGSATDAVLLPSDWPMAIAFGLSISFHPVVGMWFVIAWGMTIGCELVLRKHVPSRSELLTAVLMFLGILIAALPGLLPVATMLSNADALGSARAAELQVFVRLAHHLDPLSFRLVDVIGYAVLGGIGLLLWWRYRSDATSQQHLWPRFLLMTVLIAFVGFLIAVGPRENGFPAYAPQRASLLKFYPFRLFDALLPLFVSVLIVNICGNRSAATSIEPQRRWLPTALAGAMFAGSFLLPGPQRLPYGITRSEWRGWIETCRWIREHTANDALCMTPLDGAAFKWYAQRAEYFAIKDCPQDAASLIEWEARIEYFYDWAKRSRGGGFDDGELTTFHERTGVDYLITKPISRPVARPIVHRNEFYVVYDLQE